MRIFISMVFLLTSCFGKKSSDYNYIRIEHIGPRDKHITAIIISTTNLPINNWERIVVVNESSFNKICGYIGEIKNDFSLKDEKVSFQDWEVFSITSSSGKEELTFVTSTKTASIAFFTQLDNNLRSIENEEGIKSVIHELQILLKRIE